MKTIDNIIISRKSYIKPEIIRVALDNSISLVMMTDTPPNPPPRGSGSKGTDSPFASPFGDKSFS
ncbi:MAG: hypothetical protein LLG13_18765 [Bacteroidales bacterium]|nr:hypothetical protein [Bacteroidales bacterium]